MKKTLIFKAFYHMDWNLQISNLDAADILAIEAFIERHKGKI